MYTLSLNMASTPRRSPRLDMKRTCLEAEMESPTIRKVRACFGEAEEQLFSPIQECLTLQASYYFVNGFTSNIFTVYTSQIIAQFFSLFYRKLSIVYSRSGVAVITSLYVVLTRILLVVTCRIQQCAQIINYTIKLHA